MHGFVDHVEARYDDKHRRHRFFLICDSCFWCASAPQRVRNETISKCPSCYGDRINMTPILGG